MPPCCLFRLIHRRMTCAACVCKNVSIRDRVGEAGGLREGSGGNKRFSSSGRIVVEINVSIL